MRTVRTPSILVDVFTREELNGGFNIDYASDVQETKRRRRRRTRREKTPVGTIAINYRPLTFGKSLRRSNANG